MKLTIKTGDLEKILISINKLMKKELPIQISFQLKKIYKQLENEIKIYEESKLDLLNKYADRDDYGNLKIENEYYVIKKENRDDFANEMNSLNNIDIELEFEPISIQYLSDVKLTAEDLIILEDFLVE